MKNMNEIREMLCEAIEDLKSEKTTAANVNAIVNATGKILGTIKLEMEYSRLIGKQPKVDFIKLGEKSLVEKS